MKLKSNLLSFQAVLFAVLARHYSSAVGSSLGGTEASGAIPVATLSCRIVDIEGDHVREECVAAAAGARPNDVAEHDQHNASRIFELILADEWEDLDPIILTKSIAALKQRGAHRCWHKHSTFLDHLLGAHNILRLWGQGSNIGRVGLFHSAYSNSYVNLALFDPATERSLMEGLIGRQAEEVVHLFCSFDRQSVVVNTLLKQGFIPVEGLTVPHLRKPDETVYLSAETLRLLLVFTMADIADQYFGWQDLLFGGGGMQGSMIIPGQDFPERHDSTAIWPGISKPGLWMSYISELGQVVRNFHDSHPQLNTIWPIPPIFSNLTVRLSHQDEQEARDLYWSVILSEDHQNHETVIATLQQSHAKNPWAFEPLVLLAHQFLCQNDFRSALQAAGQALELQQQWGTAWDKRLSFNAWVAWTRVLYQRAEDQKPWPTNSWDVNNFGLVR